MGSQGPMHVCVKRHFTQRTHISAPPRRSLAQLPIYQAKLCSLRQLWKQNVSASLSRMQDHRGAVALCSRSKLTFQETRRQDGWCSLRKRGICTSPLLCLYIRPIWIADINWFNGEGKRLGLLLKVEPRPRLPVTVKSFPTPRPMHRACEVTFCCNRRTVPFNRG